MTFFVLFNKHLFIVSYYIALIVLQSCFLVPKYLYFKFQIYLVNNIYIYIYNSKINKTNLSVLSFYSQYHFKVIGPIGNLNPNPFRFLPKSSI